MRWAQRLKRVFGIEFESCARCGAAVDSRGRVVKIIGDEIMCVFPDAEHAYLAATEMQIRVAELSSQPVPESQMQPGAHSRAIRVGFHAGAVIEENGDLFGDTVNVASRMTAIAKANQIMTTDATVARLPDLLRISTREIAALAVKGKGEAISVFEVIWQTSEDLTMAITVQPNMATVSMIIPRSLRLERGEFAIVLDLEHPGVVLGRDPHCATVRLREEAAPAVDTAVPRVRIGPFGPIEGVRSTVVFRGQRVASKNPQIVRHDRSQEIPMISFAAGAGQSFTFSSVVGVTNCCSSAPSTGPDGDPGLTSIPGANGVSGITASAVMFLAGVFLDDATPAGAGPAAIDFTGNIGFASLSPLLGQLFFIGDGRTGTGSGALQVFNAPAGATRLYLGIADAFAFGGQHGWYNDNRGEFGATFELTGGTAVVPVPAALPLLLSGLGLFGWLARRRG